MWGGEDFCPQHTHAYPNQVPLIYSFNPAFLQDHHLLFPSLNADHIPVAGDEPLYSEAPISCRESWTSIYKFSVSNRLTDSATKDLLKLISRHCPDSSRCPQTLHKLKKLVGSLECMSAQYCSVCMDEVLMGEKKCGKCTDDSQICYYTVLPFEEHLKEIFVGKS